MKSEATYTLWHNGDLLWRGEHNRDTLDEMFEEAFELDGTVEIYSTKDGDDLVWSSLGDHEGEPYDMSDVEADADTLASAGYGMDEDYGGAWDSVDTDGIYY